MKRHETGAFTLADRVRDWLSTDIGRAAAYGNGQNLLITDADRLVVWANPSFLELTGFELEEIRGRSPRAFMQGAGSDPDSVTRMKAALNAGKSISEDLLNYRKSGELLWIRMRIDPIHADDGTLVGFIGLGVDFTSQKLLESHFEMAQSASSPLLEALPLSVPGMPLSPPIAILTDLSGRIRHISASGRSAFGYFMEEMLDRLSLVDLLVPAPSNPDGASQPGPLEIGDSVIQAEVLERLLNAGSGQQVEVFCRTGRKQRSKALLVSTPFDLKEGVVTGYRCLLLGLEAISERTIPDYPTEQLATPHTRPDLPGTLIQFITHEDGIVWTYFPRSAASLLRVQFEDPGPIGLKWLLYAFHPKERCRILFEFAKAKRNLLPFSITAELIQSETAEPRWVRITASPEARPEGELKWHGFILDESVQVLSELESSRKSKLLELMVDITTSFVDSDYRDVDRVIDEALAHAGNFFGVDRAFVFDYDFTTSTTSNTHEWVSEGTEPFKDVLQAVSIDEMEDWLDAHVAGEVINIADVDRLPNEETRKILQMQGIKSVMSVPMMVNEACIGFVRFDGVRNARTFSEGEISLLQLFSKNMVGFKAKAQAASESEHSKRRLMDVISAAGEFVWEIDCDGYLTYISDQSAEAFGRAPESLVGLKLGSFVPNSEIDRFEKWLRNLYADRAPFVNEEYYVQLNDGSLRIHNLSGTPIFLNDGTCIGFRGVGLDITHERNLSLSLRNAQNEIATFFEVAIDLVIICDTEGKIVRLSRSWEKLMEIPVEEMQGRYLTDFVHTDDVARTTRELEDLKTKSGVAGFINRWITQTGSTVSLEWTAASHQGLYFACARDISMRQEAQFMLRQALESERESSEIKGRLIAMTSHEFRTPLSAIRLAAEMIQNNVSDADLWMQGKIETIIARADFLESVVADVLDLQVIRDSQILCRNDSKLKRETLGTIVESVCAEFRSPEGGFERISLFFDGHSETTVPTDPVGRALRNLIENALKYSPPKELVIVRTLPCQLGIEVRVIDKGPGVQKDEVDQIFNDFFRGENSSFVRGTGLGLPIAMEAARRLEGFIAYKREPGGPTIFTLQFPIP